MTSYNLPPNYLMQAGPHILASGYQGGIFTYINHAPIMIPLAIDATGTMYKTSDVWATIPTVEPVRLLVPMSDGKQWCVGLLGQSTGGVQLVIIRPELYDEAALERKRKIFKRNGSFYIPAGSLVGVQVQSGDTTFQVNFTVSTEGNHFSFNATDWISVPPKTAPFELVIPIRGVSWLIGYIYFVRKGRIELQIVSPTQYGPVPAA